jgi:hypothetical protein
VPGDSDEAALEFEEIALGNRQELGACREDLKRLGLARRTAIKRISLCDLQNMRTTVIALFLITAPFLLHAQQQNEGDFPSGKSTSSCAAMEKKFTFPPWGQLTGSRTT